MICDRKRRLTPLFRKSTGTLRRNLKQPGSKKALAAKFYGNKDGKIAIRNKEELDGILKELEGCDYVVDEVKNGERIKKAPIPFTTSTLQQEAYQSTELFHTEDDASGPAAV